MAPNVEPVRFTTRLPQDLHDRLEAYAQVTERSHAAVIRHLIRTHIPPQPTARTPDQRPGATQHATS